MSREIFRDNVTKAGMTKVGIGCALYAVATNLPVAMSPLFDNTHGICFGVNENLGEVSRGMAVAVVFAHFFVLPSVVALVCVVAAIVKLLFTQDSRLAYTTWKCRNFLHATDLHEGNFFYKNPNKKFSELSVVNFVQVHCIFDYCK